MSLILFDTIRSRRQLYPFTAIRPVAEMRTGLLTIAERWSIKTGKQAFVLTEPYLQRNEPERAVSLYIDAVVIPDESLIQTIVSLNEGEGLLYGNEVIAVCTAQPLTFGFSVQDLTGLQWKEWEGAFRRLNYAFELAQFNAEAITEDFELITADRASQSISATNHVICPENVFLEEGAVVEYCFINASQRPVYIGRNSLVMEGSMIRGPFALLENSVVKMGSKIYGATTVGRSCTVGGEIKNVVFFDYSNKAHDGYLGDAVIGSWCNIGAGTSGSNVKNTAGPVKVWNATMHQWIEAGMKCGVLMGDYTRTAINTSLNTGTVTGISCNVFHNGFVPKFIPDFTWNCGTQEPYVLEKVISDLRNWMRFKQKELSATDEQILTYLYSKQSQKSEL